MLSFLYNGGMPATREEVETLVHQAFPNAEAEIKLGAGFDEVWGYIYWPEFKGMNLNERNKLVTERVRSKLGYRGLNVGLLIPIVKGEKL